MRRGTPPVNPVLDLWSLGHSASQVAEMLAVEGGRKKVTKIVEQARSIGDKRAVLHASSDGRLIGRPARMARPPVAIVVPAAPQITHCKRSHPATPENRTRSRHCRLCEIERDLRRRGR